MVRTQAAFPGGVRFSDYLGLGVIAQVFPHGSIEAALDACGVRSARRRDLPLEAMGLFRQVSTRELLRCLADGLRLVAPGVPVRISGKSSISRARSRLGTAPFEELRRARELAGLYHERWEIENAYDEVKTHLLGPGAALRSKTPDLVLQEIDGLMLAQCAVRSLIHRAAGKAREDPDGISFIHAVRMVRRHLQNPGAVSP